MGKNKLKPKPKPPVKDPLPEPELVMEFEGRKPEKEAAKEPEIDEAALQRREQRRARRQKIRSALDGSVLLDKGLQKYGWLVLYVFFLAMLLIANNYRSEAVVRECSLIKGELKDLRYRQIESQANLTQISLQSSVAKRLQETGLKESVVPPYKIKETKESAKGRKK
ncbi:MAG: FtsL-like putative cell division protein [Bacteroides sp.]|nr:FtsL-like putative cell division protein [Ruminococcus flavefaciens]MCM1554151.1 FtsL-like putative cell division protein [Bacteroides sp.]